MDTYEARFGKAFDTAMLAILPAIEFIAEKEQIALEDALFLLTGAAVQITTIQSGKEFVRALCESCIIDGIETKKDWENSNDPHSHTD